MQVLCAEHLSLSMSAGPSLHGLQQNFAKPAHWRGLGRGGRVLAMVREHRDSQEIGLQVTGRDSCSPI